MASEEPKSPNTLRANIEAAETGANAADLKKEVDEMRRQLAEAEAMLAAAQGGATPSSAARPVATPGKVARQVRLTNSEEVITIMTPERPLPQVAATPGVAQSKQYQGEGGRRIRTLQGHVVVLPPKPGS